MIHCIRKKLAQRRLRKAIQELVDRYGVGVGYRVKLADGWYNIQLMIGTGVELSTLAPNESVCSAGCDVYGNPVRNKYILLRKQST